MVQKVPQRNAPAGHDRGSQPCSYPVRGREMAGKEKRGGLHALGYATGIIAYLKAGQLRASMLFQPFRRLPAARLHGWLPPYDAYGITHIYIT